MGVRVLLVLGVLVVALAAGLVWRARNGRFTAARDDAGRLTAAELGAPLGAAATFVQLSSAACAPCRATAAVLGALAGDRPGVVHVEVPADERLDLVRRFDVLRTPTVLVLDGAGAVRGRFSGATTRDQALAALDAAAGCPVPAR